MVKNMEVLMAVFKQLISNSNYPQISWNDFTAFGNQLGLFDASFGLSTFDRLFIATNVTLNNKTKPAEAATQELRRFEYFEILVRIAGSKYKDKGGCKSY